MLKEENKRGKKKTYNTSVTPLIRPKLEYFRFLPHSIDQNNIKRAKKIP